MTSPEDDLARSWNSNAPSWMEAVRSGAIQSRRVATDGAILDLVLSLSPRAVLDVGCGEGWLCRALSARSIRMVGVDGSEPLIRAARDLGGAEYHLLEYRVLESATATMLAGPFDVVVFNFALLQDDHRALLTQVREWLAPDGAIAIQTLHPWAAPGEHRYQDGWRSETFQSLGDGWEPMPWFYRTLASWADELRDSGYLIADVREPTPPGDSTPLSLLIVATPDARILSSDRPGTS
jgi:2-polyprenyl-3-methyl-5-hydroxy-6-metoxy-1,4-benzoquinol methylase